MAGRISKEFKHVQTVPAQHGYLLVCENQLKFLLSNGAETNKAVDEVIRFARPIIAWMICRDESDSYFDVRPVTPVGVETADNYIIICPNGFAMTFDSSGENLEKFIKYHITKELQWT